MLKKTNRLSSVRIKKSKLINSRLMDIKIGQNNLQFSRFGFVISKKIDKRAVVRNSLKRKLSACVEEIFDRIEGGHDFVFYPKREILDINQEILSTEVKKMLENEGLLK
jgi:ribonuclease P protein component